jgi:hypothetical protein
MMDISKPTDQAIASLNFTDGVMRTVFVDAEDNQYVLSGGGECVYGVWMLADEPLICVDPTSF